MTPWTRKTKRKVAIIKFLTRQIKPHTAFVVACAISFRSLFVQHRNKLSAAEAKKRTPTLSVQKHKNRFRYYFGKMSATLVSTAQFLEGHGYDHETWKLPMPTSGLMTVDFSHDDGWRRMPHDGDGESMQTFNLKQSVGDVERGERNKKWDGNFHTGTTLTTTTVN